MPQSGEITKILRELNKGDADAQHMLAPLVYSQLRRAAAQLFRHERPGHTLQPTALVHETFVRVMNGARPTWQSRAHFFGVAARAMRQILVDHSRKHKAEKRGSGLAKLELDDKLAYSPEKTPDVEALHDALEKLEKLDKRQAKVVELRFFGGLTIKETASVLRVSASTVKDDWALARAWLIRELDV